MSAASTPTTPAFFPEETSATSLTLHGLAASTSLALLGPQVPELRKALETAWSRCLTPCGAEPPTPATNLQVLLGPAPEPAAEADPPVAAERLDALLQQTTQAVTRTFITAQTGRLLMLHAGACADQETGAAVAYVAPGGTGKTTLSRVLGRTLGYLTDETVGITATGRIRPYPKPLSIRTDGRGAVKVETSPDEVGLLTAPTDPWLRRIVLLDRSDSHTGSPRLEQLGLADAIVALAPETSALSRLDRPLHLLADLIGATGPVLRCHYRDARDLAPVLADLVEVA